MAYVDVPAAHFIDQRTGRHAVRAGAVMPFLKDRRYRAEAAISRTIPRSKQPASLPCGRGEISARKAPGRVAQRTSAVGQPKSRGMLRQDPVLRWCDAGGWPRRTGPLARVTAGLCSGLEESGFIRGRLPGACGFPACDTGMSERHRTEGGRKPARKFVGFDLGMCGMTLGVCAARRFIEENVLFSVNFRPRERPKIRNRAKNHASGNVYAIFPTAIFSAVQAPSAYRFSRQRTERLECGFRIRKSYGMHCSGDYSPTEASGMKCESEGISVNDP